MSKARAICETHDEPDPDGPFCRSAYGYRALTEGTDNA